MTEWQESTVSAVLPYIIILLKESNKSITEHLQDIYEDMPDWEILATSTELHNRINKMSVSKDYT